MSVVRRFRHGMQPLFYWRHFQLLNIRTFVHKGPNDKSQCCLRLVAWYRTSNKPLPQTILVAEPLRHNYSGVICIVYPVPPVPFATREIYVLAGMCATRSWCNRAPFKKSCKLRNFDYDNSLSCEVGISSFLTPFNFVSHRHTNTIVYTLIHPLH